MVKLVILKLYGDLNRGFQVSLEIGEDGQLSEIKTDSNLPPNAELEARSRQHWEEKYRNLSLPLFQESENDKSDLDSYRIKRPEVIYGGHINSRLQDCKKSAKKLEKSFNEWLRSESFLKVREEWLAFVNSSDEVRVLIQTQDPLVQKLPWHRWDLLQRYRHAEAALSYQEFKRREKPDLSSKDKVKILAIFGTSEGINIQTDRELLEKLKPDSKLEVLIEPKRQQINHKLWEQSWDIIFFAGHSETEGNEGRIYINATDSLPIHELWYALRKAVENGLQLAIFNSCDGLGLARSLDDILIPQTIVMRERVPDRVAQEFLRYFLGAFASGKSLYLAVREARERLQGWEKDFPCATWLPIIYQNPAEVPLSWDEYRGLTQKDEERKRTQIPEGFSRIIAKIWAKKVPIALSIVLIVLVSIAYPFAVTKIGISLNKLAVKNIESQKFDWARFYLKLARHLFPNKPQALNNIGYLDWLANKPRVLNNMGYLYIQFGEREIARDYFRQAKMMGDPWGCNNEAFLDLRAGDYQKADTLLRTCLGQMQQNQSELGEYLVRKNLGWALLRKASDWKSWDYAEAEDHLRIAIELKSDLGIANCVLAQVLEAQTRNSEALEEWQLCLKYVPNDTFPESDWKKQAQQRLEAAQKLIEKPN